MFRQQNHCSLQVECALFKQLPNSLLKYLPLTLQSHQDLMVCEKTFIIVFLSFFPLLTAAAREERVGEAVSDAVRQDSSQLTSAPNGITSPPQESQPLPQPCFSPVLAQYKSYLQSYYSARALAPADKYLPTLQAPYINLAMIERGHQGSDARDEFTRRTLHGGVDEILASKTPIHIEDLLVPKEGSESVRFILVEGPPGIGKSTFAWEVCKKWDEIENLRSYPTVVLLRLTLYRPKTHICVI